MSAEEFDVQAASIAAAIADRPLDDRIVGACRGSANPVALAWLAEALRLGPDVRVLDLGAGIGGPAAWLVARYGCEVIALEPAGEAAAAVPRLFGIAAVVASACDLPLRPSGFDAALALGVLSVVDDPHRLLTAATAVADRIGILDYASAGAATIEAGGSTFRSSATLLEMVTAAGWRVTEASEVSVPPPRSWTQVGDSIEVDPVDSEDEVRAAAAAEAIAPFMVVATRRACAPDQRAG